MENEDEDDQQADYIDKKALLMMQKMGYKTGSGLGKKQEGILEPVEISGNLGTRGFGLKLENLTISDEVWNCDQEHLHLEEAVEWLQKSKEETLDFESMLKWIVKGPSKDTIHDETHFCDPNILNKLLLAKQVLDEFDPLELCRARSRANPFESIKNAIFMNRAAVKMANIDAATNFMFSDIDRNPLHRKAIGPYYFADVCAGPGGFSEYMLWRKKWLFKGFGFTLRGEHDFQLIASTCASPVTFNSMYGMLDDGDVCCPDNIRHFVSRVRKESEEKGVHFMMSDGGFCVDGNENLQEVLSKQLYICQCLMSLEIVRAHGHFVTKVFDLFTPFSVGLLYLMHQCYGKMGIFKPNSSRPANSERYLIFADLQTNDCVSEIKQYLWQIVTELFELRQIQTNFSIDINEIVPLSVMQNDLPFINYISDRNNRIASSQLLGLSKLVLFCRNILLIEPRQEELRKKCLQYWRIPEEIKLLPELFTIDDLLYATIHNPDFLRCQLTEINEMAQLDQITFKLNEWRFTLCQSSKKRKYCNFYAAIVGSKVYRLQKYKWERVKHLQLISGTILYGEMVKETIKCGGFFNSNKDNFKRSLHAIDALRLGETSLVDLPYKERLDLIETYCQAVNHDSRKSYVRVRSKLTRPLELLPSTSLSNVMDLPLIGYNSLRETYCINSIILHDDNEDFETMHTQRIQIYLANESEEKTDFSPQSLVEYFEKRLSNA